jgi:hypothetical protein
MIGLCHGPFPFSLRIPPRHLPLASKGVFGSKARVFDWLAVIILGLVEGITEFIPVSSTGHLLLTERLLNIYKSDLFNIVIQCGAVLAVLPLFPQRLRQVFNVHRDPAARDYMLKVLWPWRLRGDQVTSWRSAILSCLKRPCQ